MQDESINKKLFFDVWSGKSTLLQRRKSQEWLSEPENMETYYEWLDEWEKENLQVYSDVNMAYHDFLQIRSSLPQAEAKRKIPLVKNRRAIMVAATVLGVLLAGALFFSGNFIFYKSYATANGEVRKVTLPDNSVVYLNANSSVRYARFNFNKELRKVYMSGEAEFDVTHTASHTPFEVYGDRQLKISVLGTKFVVYSRGDSTSVVLAEGKIELTKMEAGKQTTTVLKPGDHFTTSANEVPKISLVENPAKISAWKNHEFIFDGTSVNTIGLKISDIFGYTVLFENDEIAQRTISGSFHAENVLELVDAISQLLQLDYKIIGNEIHFSE